MYRKQETGRTYRRVGRGTRDGKCAANRIAAARDWKLYRQWGKMSTYGRCGQKRCGQQIVKNKRAECMRGGEEVQEMAEMVQDMRGELYFAIK